MPVCNGCGASYDSNYKFCPYCGREKPVPPKVEISLTVNEAPGNIQCPSCKRSSKVYKVSGIKNSRPDLQMLPEPVAPENSCIFYPGVVFLLIAVLFILIGVLVNGNGAEVLAPFVFSASFGVLGITFVRIGSVKSTKRAEYDEKVRKWNDAKKYWADLYYCQGCDVIFLPQNGSFSSPDTMANFLYGQIEPLKNEVEEAISPKENPDYKYMSDQLRD